MLIARRGTDGLAPRTVPCTPVLKNVAVKSKRKVCKETALFHAKSTKRIGCWNVRTLGSLSGQNEKLRNALRTMREKKIEVLALSESRYDQD